MRCRQAKISSSKSWLFPESLLKSDGEVRFVMAVSLLPVSLDKPEKMETKQHVKTQKAEKPPFFHRVKTFLKVPSWILDRENDFFFFFILICSANLQRKSTHFFFCYLAMSVFQVNVWHGSCHWCVLNSQITEEGSKIPTNRSFELRAICNCWMQQWWQAFDREYSMFVRLKWPL